MKTCVIVIGLLLMMSSPAWAQRPVPQIPFDSVPNFLKLPADMYLGEVSGVAVNSKGHVFVYQRGNTNGPAYAAAAAQLLEFGADGKYIREIGHNLYAWSFAHTMRIDKQDNNLDHRQRLRHGDQVQSRGPRGNGFRTQAGSFRRRHRASETSQAAPPCRRRHVPAGNRRDLGSRGQHLHQRWLHQLARGQSGQEWRLAEILG